MIPTLATLVSNSLTGLSWLSPVEVVAALAALSYAIGGLIALRIAERRAVSTTDREPLAKAPTRLLRELTFRPTRGRDVHPSLGPAPEAYPGQTSKFADR
jgi:hypothetical protein